MDDFFFFYFDEDTDTTTQVSVDELDIDQDELEFIYDDKVRKVWHGKEQEWYFSIVDVCGVLVESSAPKKYWSKLKRELLDSGIQPSTISRRLKMKSTDGKMRLTDVASTEQLFRIIQSIPSKKAEPFKQWLAQVGKERLDEIADPELSINRAVENYRRKGYSEAWITQRMRTIEMRKDLTDEWKRTGVTEPRDFASLTNILTHAWSGKTVANYKKLKNLKTENLRDNMTNTELALNMLAEVSATALSRSKNPETLKDIQSVTHEGGSIAGNARKELESKLGHSVLSSSNANDPLGLDDTKKITGKR